MKKNSPIESKHKGKIWIDLENSPHIPFFNPIIRELENHGHEVFITARDCFQVCELADLFQLKYKKVGRHFGKNKVFKIIGLLWRTLQFMPFITKINPNLAVSHGSRSQMLYSAINKISFAVIMDYEHAQSLPFVHPNCIIMPEAIPDGIVNEKVMKYPGIKEDVYAADFKPDRSVLESLGIKSNEIIVTIRPPADEAHYHNPESELLYKASIDHIIEKSTARIILLPRNRKKHTAYANDMWPDALRMNQLIIPKNAVNGMDLIWFSDVVISGGGTMNREAAALNVPVYSIFRGKIGAVDRSLSDNGRLIFIENLQDIEKKLKIEKRNKDIEKKSTSRDTLDTIVKYILKMANNSSSI